MKPFDKRINIVTGHYGSGKTNLAVNMAMDLAARGKKTCLVDLDIVNPYFRAADMTAKLEAAGVRVIAPLFAGTNLDLPALPGEVNAVFDDRSYAVLLDVGGDDAGAAALGRYSKLILKENDFEHFYVINAKRALTQSAEEAVSILHEIEATGRVPVTALVNNTNLSTETDAGVIEDSTEFMRAAAKLTGLPVAFTSVKRSVADSLRGLVTDIYPVDIYVNPPW
jgi:hypothetical protein